MLREYLKILFNKRNKEWRVCKAQWRHFDQGTTMSMVFFMIIFFIYIVPMNKISIVPDGVAIYLERNLIPAQQVPLLHLAALCAV
jgi:hypothetical protein